MRISNRFLPIWISFKFILHSRKSKHIKVITLTTIIGLTLGVSALITVLSIMNGFTSVAKNRITNLLPHVTIDTINDYENYNTTANLIDPSDPTSLAKKYLTPEQSKQKTKNLEQIIINKLGREKIANIYPNLQKKAFIVNNQKLIPIWLNALPSSVIRQKLAALNPNNSSDPNYIYNGIVLSSNIIEKLDNNKNLSLITSDNFFKYYNIDIKNIFTASDQLMANIAFIDIDYACKLFNDYTISNINIDLNYPSTAPDIVESLQTDIPLDISNWTDFVGNYFNVLAYTKEMMFLLLSCIIIVAMFNLIATLTTVLNEKQSELAILKTLGINKSFLVKLFISYGFIITSIGLATGIILGVILAANISTLASMLEKFVQYKFVNPDIYFINYLPSEISNSDIFNIVSIVYFIMFLAIIYPAIKASKIMPAQTLRHQ
ncbi:MAG: FtsX-like permease family protein [Gammaproteobacteria bacterium]|nr:FtsX-like permease family protein [Gammaproteobacteria bacterium]